MKKLLISIMVASLLLVPQPNITKASITSTCSGGLLNSVHDGMTRSSAGFMHGVQSRIWTPNAFLCDSHDGDMYIYVSIVPDLVHKTKNTIIQMGIMFTQIYPTGNYFWAWGGCAGNTPLPHAFGGHPSSGYHLLDLDYNSASDRYEGIIDGVQKITLNPHNAAVNCWLPDITNHDYEFACEKWDLNNHCGFGSANFFSNTWYRRDNNAFVSVNWATGNCDLVDFGTCTVDTPQEFYIVDG